MLGEIVDRVHRVQPLVHCITNYVTANDCANLLLACGGSAVMADDPGEAAAITAMSSGLVLNMGTPDARRLEAMLAAGQTANRLGIPVVLDPVGAGSSPMRLEWARRLMREVRFAAVRGNAGEIAALALGKSARRGVDDDGTTAPAAFARSLALDTGAIIAVTGNLDMVTDGKQVFHVSNGHPMMRCVTGAGCQLSALTGAYLAASPSPALPSVLAAVCAMGLCGEIAHGRLKPADGNASYRNYIIDAMYNLSPDALEKGAKYEAE